jgi:ABC-type bacteriocin/lantibiotic exporter with double-glycine peptidase domain
MEQTEELVKAIESANGGMWMPLITIASVFSVVIILLLYIWNMTQKSNDKRHKENENIIGKLSEAVTGISLVLVKLETNQENQQKEIDNILS